MTRVLEAWFEGVHVGQFLQDERDTQFVYDSAAPESPITLSLPRSGTASRNAASNYLENLLPDADNARLWMKRVTGAASTEPFDLLEKVGGDVAGGLVLLPEGEQVPDRDELLDPATDDQIAERIHTLKRDRDMWLDPDGHARFSMAGTQGKFALADIDGDWYWSNARLPSTHILKPGNPKDVGVEQLERSSLDLARAAGIGAAFGSILSTLGESAYIVSRFDRIDGRRIHAEDFAQASGTPPAMKYRMTARQAIELLRTVDPDDGLGHEFVRQLAFNTMLGNADAHAKNYSLIVRPTGIVLAPLYDSIPTMLWPDYDNGLAMKIGGARFAPQVTIDHWRKLAETSGLDPDSVTAEVAQIAAAMGENLQLLQEGVSENQAARVSELVRRNIEKITSPKPAGRS